MYKITSYKFINNNSKFTTLYLHGWQTNYKYMEKIAISNKTNHLLIDLPCFGKNKEPLSPLTLVDYKDSICHFLKTNDFTVDIIVAHSFGGKISVLLANCLNIKSMVLISPSIFHKSRGLIYYMKIFTYKIIKRFKRFQGLLLRFGSQDYRSLSPVMKKTMSNVINFSVKHDLRKINIFTYLVFSSNDKITPFHLGKKIQKNLIRCKLIKIQGDHFAYLKNIGLINHLIEKALKKC